MKRLARRRESAAAWLRRVGHMPAPRLGEAYTGGALGNFDSDWRATAGVGFTRKRKVRV